jgi:5'-nucleotidase
MADGTKCMNLNDYKFVLSRINIDINPFTKDVNQCGSDNLPTESDVMGKGDCFVTISAFWGNTKLDVDKATQTTVRDKLASILTCA